MFFNLEIYHIYLVDPMSLFYLVYIITLRVCFCQHYSSHFYFVIKFCFGQPCNIYDKVGTDLVNGLLSHLCFSDLFYGDDTLLIIHVDRMMIQFLQVAEQETLHYKLHVYPC